MLFDRQAGYDGSQTLRNFELFEERKKERERGRERERREIE